MCFVWISEQTAIISLYSINWLVFITEMECLLRGTAWIFLCNRYYTSKAQWLLYVPPGLPFNSSTFCPHSVFMCVVWISEQTAIISLYSINWLVFITETECVYCAVRSGSLNIILRSAPHSVFMCFVWISEQTAIISLYSIIWLVFITETECVYCAVRPGSLNIILRSAHTVYLCVLCGSQNKQRLLPYTTLTYLTCWSY
jgi:putative hemolysin